MPRCQQCHTETDEPCMPETEESVEVAPETTGEVNFPKFEFSAAEHELFARIWRELLQIDPTGDAFERVKLACSLVRQHSEHIKDLHGLKNDLIDAIEAGDHDEVECIMDEFFGEAIIEVATEDLPRFVRALIEVNEANPMIDEDDAISDAIDILYDEGNSLRVMMEEFNETLDSYRNIDERATLAALKTVMGAEYPDLDFSDFSLDEFMEFNIRLAELGETYSNDSDTDEVAEDAYEDVVARRYPDEEVDELPFDVLTDGDEPNDDLTHVESIVYTYVGDDHEDDDFVIDQPIARFIRDSGVHLILTADGDEIEMAPGWKQITISRKTKLAA